MMAMLPVRADAIKNARAVFPDLHRQFCVSQQLSGEISRSVKFRAPLRPVKWRMGPIRFMPY